MSKLTPERLAEIEQQLMSLQHELQSSVQSVNPDNNRMLKGAQDDAVQNIHTSRAWVLIMKGYLVS